MTTPSISNLKLPLNSPPSRIDNPSSILGSIAKIDINQTPKVKKPNIKSLKNTKETKIKTSASNLRLSRKQRNRPKSSELRSKSSTRKKKLKPRTRSKNTKRSSSSDIRKKKKTQKQNKIFFSANKGRFPRITDASDIRLHSMLHILRRSILLKKQQSIIECALTSIANKKNTNGMQSQLVSAPLECEILLTPQRSSAQSSELIINPNHANPLLAHDLMNVPSPSQKMNDDLFQTHIIDGTVQNINPLLSQHSRLSIDDKNYPTIGDEFGFNANENKQSDEQMAPPLIFNTDHSLWTWDENDIAIEDKKQLTFLITLHLLYFGLSNGPLFPNSILKWQRLKFKNNAPTPRSSHVSACLNNKMIIFGGQCSQMLTDHIFVVDTIIDNDNSLEVTPISSVEKIHKTYRVGHCGVPLAHNNCLYLFGGWNDKQYINHGLLFNVKSLKLVVEQQKDRILPPARRDHTLVQMGPYLLLFGGWSHDFFNNDIWCLSSNWHWTMVKDIKGMAPCPRRGHTSCVIGSQMFVFGGLYGVSRYLNDLHVYNGDNNEWMQPSLIGRTKPQPRAWHTANVMGKSQILIFGGTQGRVTFFDDCWVFDTQGYFWFQIEIESEVPRPRCSHTMVEVFADDTFLEDAFCEDTKYQDEHSDERGERKCRLRWLMFGGLVTYNADESAKGAARKVMLFADDEKDEKDDNVNVSVSVKKKKQTKKKKNGKKKQKTKVDSAVTGDEEETKYENDDGVITQPPSFASKSMKHIIDDVLMSDYEYLYDTDGSFVSAEEESDYEEDTDDEPIDRRFINKIRLSDDLYQLMLEV